MFSVLTLDAGHALPLLLDVAAKSLLVSAAALTALACLSRASAATRHLVLLAGLGVLLGLPALMALLPRQALPLTLGVSGRASSTGSVTGSTGLNPRALALQAPASVGEGLSPKLSLMPAQAGIRSITARGFSPVTAPVTVQAPPVPAPALRPGWLVLGWLVGVLACTGRMLAAQARVWRLTWRCPPMPPSLLPAADLEAGCFAALLTGPAGTPPMVWGWPRAALLLPPEAADWPPTRLRAVVLHESAHVRRQDWLTQTLAQIICALYWFNPLVWLLAARLGAEAERACDDAVLLAGIPPTDYAQELLAVARHLGAGRTQRRLSVGAVTMARRSPVRGRLEAILDTRRVRRHVTRRSAGLALAAALAVAAPLASLRPAARAAEGKAAQAAPLPGVPTEADIAKVQQHLQGLEQARAGYAAAHPNTLSLTQIGYLDGLRQQAESDRTWEHLVATEKNPLARAKLLNVIKEHNVAQVGRNYRAMVKPRVDRIPPAQVAREVRMHDFDEAIALNEARVEMMQMEHSLGYPLHIPPDSIAVIAHSALYWEKTGRMSRADSVHVSLLQQKAGQKKRLDDADIDSLIVILRKPSTDPSINRSDVMQLFSMLPQSSPAQQQKMREAITPLLKSRSHWERDQVEQTLKKLGGSAPTPPPAQKAQAVPAATRQATLLRTAAFAPPADGSPTGQTAPLPGVPTEADIAQARQHLLDMEKARADYTAAHPGTLSPTQVIERESAKTALRLQIIQLQKSMAALDRQGIALRTPGVVAFEEKRHQMQEQTYTDMDQIGSAGAKSILYPAQAAHWKQVSANALARLRRRQAEIRAMRPPTPEGAAEVARYDSYMRSSLSARGRWMQIEDAWHEKYAPRRLPAGTQPAGVRGLPPGAALPNPAGQERAENALRLQIIQLQKALPALQRQMKASERAFRATRPFAADQVARYQHCVEAFNTAYKQLQDLQIKLALLRMERGQ